MDFPKTRYTAHSSGNFLATSSIWTQKKGGTVKHYENHTERSLPLEAFTTAKKNSTPQQLQQKTKTLMYETSSQWCLSHELHQLFHLHDGTYALGVCRRAIIRPTSYRSDNGFSHDHDQKTNKNKTNINILSSRCISLVAIWLSSSAWRHASYGRRRYLIFLRFLTPRGALSYLTQKPTLIKKITCLTMNNPIG